MQRGIRPPRQDRRTHNARCLAALFCATLVGCAGGALQLDALQDRRAQQAYEEALQFTEQGHYAQAAQTLWDTAQDLSSPRREQMQIESVRALFDGRHLLEARLKITQIDERALDAASLLDKRVLEATFYHEAGQPARVIALLPDTVTAQGPASLQAAALELLARALFDDGRYFDSVTTRIRRRAQLDDDDDARDNAIRLWEALIAADPAEMAEQLTALDNDDDRRLRAWLELSLLATPSEVDREALEKSYADWRRDHSFVLVPDAITERLRERWEYFDFRPRKVSLLLPLTGRYGRAGKAIRRGFLRAHDADTTELDVRFHNTDQDKDVIALYRQALAQGAEAVVGPLLKREVENLLQAADFEVPTITLNYHKDEQFRARGELFQFGLLPEDEAVQVAEKLYEKGLGHAIVLTSDNEWGRRLYRRFEQRYTELGGRIREVRYYDVHFLDYATIVQSLLQLDDSKRRKRVVERVVGGKIHFTPRIRGDVNAAVLFANHDKAALIYPLLKYYYADELPVYATSHVYAPGKEKILRELDGLIYCDIPLMLGKDAESEKPDEYPRLFALGADAYGLIRSIRHLAAGNVHVSGATGVVSADANRRLFRRLSWAKFLRGRPVPLGPIR